MRMIKLRNGSQELDIVITSTMIALDELFKPKPHMGDAIAAVELATLCRNPNHEMSEETRKRLTATGLLLQGVLHDSVRNIVLSAVEGEDFNLRLCSPVA